MIKIRAHFTDWQEVDECKAADFVMFYVKRTSRNCEWCLNYLNENYLRGACAFDLFKRYRGDYDNRYDKREPFKIVHTPIEQKEAPKILKEKYIADSATAVRMEQLARDKAFCDFLTQVIITLEIYKIDEDVQKELESPVDWLKRCADMINEIVYKDRA